MSLPYPYVLGGYSPQIASVDGDFSAPSITEAEAGPPGPGGVMNAATAAPLIQRQYG